MALDFNVLVNAALMSGAALNTRGVNKRRAKKQEDAELAAALRAQEKEARDLALHRSAVTENEAQAGAATSLAELRRKQTENPELFRSSSKPPEYQAYADYYDSLIAQGKTPTEADEAARRRFGKNQERPSRDPIEVHRANRLFDIRNPLPTRSTAGSDEGEGGSAAALKDRREFMQSRISHWSNSGYSVEEATTRAEAEYNAAGKSSGPFRDVSSGSSSGVTASALARTIPRGGSANAGKSGVKPTETTSTPARNPRDPSSPKAGAIRPATDADIDRAIEAVGEDPKKIQKWLMDRGLSG